MYVFIYVYTKSRCSMLEHARACHDQICSCLHTRVSCLDTMQMADCMPVSGGAETIYICVCIYLHVNIYTHIYICIYMYIYIYVYVYTYIYMCMRLYIHIYIYIYKRVYANEYEQSCRLN